MKNMLNTERLEEETVNNFKCHFKHKKWPTCTMLLLYFVYTYNLN